MKLFFVASHSLFLFNVIPGSIHAFDSYHSIACLKISIENYGYIFEKFEMKYGPYNMAILVKSCDWMKLESNLLKQINHSYNNQSWFQILIRHVIYAYIDTFRTKSHHLIFFVFIFVTA